jgi:hypothetical protein
MRLERAPHFLSSGSTLGFIREVWLWKAVLRPMNHPLLSLPPSGCALPAASLLRACCTRDVTKGLRRSFEGASKGFGGFPPFLPPSSAARRPTVPSPVSSSLYPYRPCCSQKVTPLLRRRYRPSRPGADNSIRFPARHKLPGRILWPGCVVWPWEWERESEGARGLSEHRRDTGGARVTR